MCNVTASQDRSGQVKRRHEKAAEAPVLVDAVGANDLKKKAGSHLWLATSRAMSDNHDAKLFLSHLTGLPYTSKANLARDNLVLTDWCWDTLQLDDCRFRWSSKHYCPRIQDIIHPNFSSLPT